MSKLFSRFSALFTSRTLAGADKAGNRYFAKKEQVDGMMKEKRWVIFKGEEDPTSIPVEWICWLNGQRKRAPTDEEMADLEARRERVKLNVALLKKEEEMKSKEGRTRQNVSPGKVGGPDLKSFIQQFPTASAQEGGEDKGNKNSVHEKGTISRSSTEKEAETDPPIRQKQQQESSEPSGSGKSYKPGTWQPPT